MKVQPRPLSDEFINASPEQPHHGGREWKGLGSNKEIPPGASSDRGGSHEHEHRRS